MTTIKVRPGVPQTMDATDNRSFEQWMAAVDALVSRSTGLSVYDLPDCPFHDWYDARLRPIRAANKALRKAGSSRE